MLKHTAKYFALIAHTVQILEARNYILFIVEETEA